MKSVASCVSKKVALGGEDEGYLPGSLERFFIFTPTWGTPARSKFVPCFSHGILSCQVNQIPKGRLVKEPLKPICIPIGSMYGIFANIYHNNQPFM